MADFYVDTAGSSANDGSSELLPKALLSQATFSANNRVFCKRGQTHPVGTYRFLASGMTLTAYGTGDRPVIQKTTGSDSWIYVQNASNVLVSHVQIDGAGYAGAGMQISAGSGHAISAVRLVDVDVYGSYGSAGLFISGTSTGTVRNVSVEDSTFYSNQNHGTLCSTDVQGVTYKRCVGHTNGSAIGAHGFSAYAASASPSPNQIRWEFCEAYGCIDYDGIEGTGIQTDDNTVNNSIVGCYTHRNQGGGLSFNAGSGHRAIGNLSVSNGKPGLYINNTTGAFAYNNTMSGNCTRGTLLGEIQCINTSTTFTATNNLLVKGSGLATHGIHLNAGSASGSTGATNAIYGYATVSVNISLSGTVTSDPLFDSSYRPTASSPCIGAATYLPSARHYGGKRMSPVSPVIGAHGYYAARTVATGRDVRLVGA